MPIGIMGRKSLELIYLTNKKREGINTFVCAVSFYVAKTPKASIKYHGYHYP